MQGIDTHISRKGLDAVDPVLLKRFGSVIDSMLSLFMAVTGGFDWEEILNPLIALSPLFIFFVCFFIVFVVLGVMNILTAIFVESASQVAAIDRDLVIQSELSRDSSTINEIKRIFYAADADRSGFITLQELEEQLTVPETLANLRVLGMDVSETLGLFQLLDMDEAGWVSIEEFVGGMMRVKGGAKGVQVATILYESKRIVVRLSALMRFVEDRLDAFETALNVPTSKPLQKYVDLEKRDTREGSAKFR